MSMPMRTECACPRVLDSGVRGRPQLANEGAATYAAWEQTFTYDGSWPRPATRFIVIIREAESSQQ